MRDLPPRLLIQPPLESLLEFRLADAIQMTGIGDHSHGPIRPDCLEGRDVEFPHGVALANEDGDWDADSLDFVPGNRQSAEAASAGRCRA